MSSAESIDASPSGSKPPNHGILQILRGELSYLKLSFIGVLSSLFVAYFQNLSAYDEKVAAQAKDDMTAATQTFTEISSALSVALSLQQHLAQDFYNALPGDFYKIDTAYLTKDARATYKDYIVAYANLHQNYNILARKAEIDLDWASNAKRDPAENNGPSTDPISMSLLGEYDFLCEKYMPAFAAQDSTAKLTDQNNSNNPPLVIDWFSAQHNVLTMEYCFDVTHKRMTAALAWASQSDIDATQFTYMTSADNTKLFKNDRPTSQVLRLNAFMSLAMSEIEKIRVKYRPIGYLCSVPFVREVKGEDCKPIRTADQTPAALRPSP
jgi:hypothetical protein